MEEKFGNTLAVSACVTVLGDRRSQLRFATTRDLWTSINLTPHVAVIHDISAHGALVEVTLPTSRGAVRVVDISLGAGIPAVTGLVRHMRPASGGENRRLLGLEFVRLSSPAKAELARLVSTRSGEAE
jgi:hypothetical protein